MSQSIFQVRPLDVGNGWAIDEYDGRGRWRSTCKKDANGWPLDKQEAQWRVVRLRRKAVNSAPKASPVNKALGLCATEKGERGCSTCKTSGGHTDNCPLLPIELVSEAFDHWHNIGWPEDKEPVKKLERALESLIMCAPCRPVSGADADCTEAV